MVGVGPRCGRKGNLVIWRLVVWLFDYRIIGSIWLLQYWVIGLLVCWGIGLVGYLVIGVFAGLLDDSFIWLLGYLVFGYWVVGSFGYLVVGFLNYWDIGSCILLLQTYWVIGYWVIRLFGGIWGSLGELWVVSGGSLGVPLGCFGESLGEF